MILLSTFANFGEGTFIQTLLEAEGIESSISDSGVELDGSVKVRVFVGEGDLERARELVAKHFENQKVDPPAKVDPHPAEGYPFVGVILFVGLLWSAGEVIYLIYHTIKGSYFHGNRPFSEYVGLILTVGLWGLFWGCFYGVGISALGAILKVVWRRFNPKNRS